MNVTYDPAAPSGKQYSIRLPDGRHVERIGRSFAEAILKRQGYSIRESLVLLAEARLAVSLPA